jgi:hypothetical protein
MEMLDLWVSRQWGQGSSSQVKFSIRNLRNGRHTKGGSPQTKRGMVETSQTLEWVAGRDCSGYGNLHRFQAQVWQGMSTGCHIWTHHTTCTLSMGKLVPMPWPITSQLCQLIQPQPPPWLQIGPAHSIREGRSKQGGWVCFTHPPTRYISFKLVCILLLTYFLTTHRLF